MLWDIIQQVQLGKTEERAASMEERITALEQQVRRVSDAVVDLVRYLEQKEGRDIDGDGRVG